MSAVDVVDLALAGNELARQVMEEAGSALGAAVATLAMVLDVDLFVVGGSVVKAGDLSCWSRRAARCRALLSLRGMRRAHRGHGDRRRRTPPGQRLDGAPRAEEANRNARPGRRVACGLAQGRGGGGDAPEEVAGVVFNVQHFSVHDGPGIRTNVFFKGCPLRCAWCCNPESQRFQPELALSAQQCIRCGQFGDVCAEPGNTAR